MIDTGTQCACGTEPATANGVEGPRCYRARLRSIRLDTSVTETRTRRNYFDAEPINEVFGEDAKERMLDETDGLGFAKPGSDGRFYHRDRKTGEVEALTEDQIDRTYLGGDDGQ